jgi:hypothetical protein
MTVIDFLIGATLMNAMPHLVLGIWKGRMFSAFGFGDKQNIAYGFLCLVISISLYSYQYGASAILNNGIYAGALVLLLIYFISGKFWYSLFCKK